MLLLAFRRRVLALLGAVVVLGVAAGCGGSSSSGSGSDAATVAAAPPGGQVANGPVQTKGDDLGTSTPEMANRHPTHAIVPVLMYHVIAPAPAGAKYAGLWVAPDALQEQVAALGTAGYTGVTLDQVLDAWAGHGTLPEHPVVLSFDDGYLSQGVAAGDILRRAGWPGVLNLAWHNLGTPGGLTAGRVKTMIGDRWEIDAHSLTHPDLTTLDAASLKREVAGSRAKIRDTFGVAADAFCYPAGKYDPAVEAAVRAAGYRAATTEVPGAARPGGDHYALPRIRVDAGVSAASVLSSVRAAVGSGA
ncbi:MAG TPA: polysaccharide deacetylase family protein [Baekduia sp.]